jgi:hypothetical protein
MRTAAAISVICWGLLSIGAYAQSAPALPASGPVGQYQIIAGSFRGASATIMLDTTTGETWVLGFIDGAGRAFSAPALGETYDGARVGWIPMMVLPPAPKQN